MPKIIYFKNLILIHERFVNSNNDKKFIIKPVAN